MNLCMSVCLSCSWRTRSKHLTSIGWDYCVCSPTDWYTYSSKQKLATRYAYDGYQLASFGKSLCYEAWSYVMDHKHRIDCSMVLIIATSFANNWPKSLAVVFATTFTAYPLNQQLLQYILGYFSIFVRTHDEYLRYISKITHRYAHDSRDN